MKAIAFNSFGPFVFYHPFEIALMSQDARPSCADGKDKPIASVVICTYNHGSYISKAIDSVLNQTCNNLECIVVDDASTDSTKDIVSKFMMQDRRVRYLRNERNMGICPSRKAGNAIAKGEWIAVLDADDWWASDKLETQLDSLSENPEAVCCLTACIVTDGKTAQFRECPEQWLSELEINLRIENLFIHSSLLVSRKAILEVDGYDDRYPITNDWDLYLRLLDRYGAGAFVYLNRPLTYYHVHGNNMSANWRRMITEERSIVRRHLMSRLWALRRPLSAHRVLSEKVCNEMRGFAASGHRWESLKLSLCLCLLSPLRRWRWLELARRLRELYTKPAPRW